MKVEGVNPKTGEKISAQLSEEQSAALQDLSRERISDSNRQITRCSNERFFASDKIQCSSSHAIAQS